MTKLELAICEAENSGEIDLDTRDIMLGILNESTAQARHALKLAERRSDIMMEIALLRQQRNDAEQKKDTRKVSQIDDKIKKLKKDELDLRSKQATIDPNGGAVYSLTSGRGVGVNLAFHNGSYKDAPEDVRKEHEWIGITKLKNAGREGAVHNPYRGNSRRKAEVKDKYKTTNGLKESVLEEIYEAELCGDITSEERQSLIDYMNI